MRSKSFAVEGLKRSAWRKKNAQQEGHPTHGNEVRKTREKSSDGCPVAGFHTAGSADD
jgi:hypothetical protein